MSHVGCMHMKPVLAFGISPSLSVAWGDGGGGMNEKEYLMVLPKALDRTAQRSD